MTLEYKSTFSFEAIMPILDEHVVWYGRILKGFFAGRPVTEPIPKIFNQWLDESRNNKSIHDSILDKIILIHQEMFTAAQNFITKAAFDNKMPLKEYEEFSRHYEEFIMAMRRIERDSAVENIGYDEKTGLRSARMMWADIDIELQRRTRQGNPFSLALMKINHFKDEWRKDPSLCLYAVQKISQIIRECLRGFDDAYYMGDEYFVLSLKHADMIGAEAAMLRINQVLTSSHISMPDDPMTEMSISAVVYEVAPNDELEKVVENLKNDLMKIEQKSAVLKYNDISPLQRFVQSMPSGSDK